MDRNDGSRKNEKIIRQVIVTLGITLVTVLLFAGLPDSSAGGKAGRSSGITQQCSETLCKVAISGSAFVPDTLKIRPGATVVWTSEDKLPHTVTDGNFRDRADPLFDSGLSSLITEGQQFDHKFDTAGSFEYFCQLHPGMVGSVVVTGESVTALSQLQIMIIMAVGVFGTFAVVAGIRLRK